MDAVALCTLTGITLRQYRNLLYESLLSELSFKEADELCESLQFNIVRQHTKFASEMLFRPCLTASKHEISRNLSYDET